MALGYMHRDGLMDGWMDGAAQHAQDKERVRQHKPMGRAQRGAPWSAAQCSGEEDEMRCYTFRRMVPASPFILCPVGTLTSGAASAIPTQVGPCPLPGTLSGILLASLRARGMS